MMKPDRWSLDQVNACEALLRLIDDVAFYPEPFAPHLVSAVSSLFALFAEAVEVIHIYIHLYIYVYIYIEREREKKIQIDR